VIVVKAIKPAKLKIDAFRLEFLTGLHDVERQVIADYKKTTATWKGDRPAFQSAISLKQPGPTLVVDASGGNEKGVKKWNWLDKGTRVRYATMSADWQSKTTPRFIGSGAGRGRMLFVSKKHPRPGIKAREWTEEITKVFTPKFKRRMEQAMRDAARKSGHGR
jgi:hypothetical protein